MSDTAIELKPRKITVADYQRTLQTDTVFNRELYARFGIRGYLVADVEHRRLLHYFNPGIRGMKLAVRIVAKYTEETSCSQDGKVKAR